jgi:muconate cycloisomerase
VSAAHFIRTVLAPELEGENPADIERLTIKLGRALAAHPFTKAGLEMALWDILGKCASLPLYRLLGGAVREYVPTKWAVSGVDPGKAAEIAGPSSRAFAP